MEQRQDRPGGLTIAAIVIVALLVPTLIVSYLVFGLQPPLPTSSSAGQQAAVTVTIPNGVGSNQSLNYEPAVATVVVGVNNTIRWVQEDSIPHTVTSTSVPSGAKSFDSKTLNKGDEFGLTLTVPGTYNYECTFHPEWMVGKIIVLAPGATGSSGGGAASTSTSSTTATSSSSSSGTSTASSAAASSGATAGTAGVGVRIAEGAAANLSSTGFTPDRIVVVIGVNNTVTWTNGDSAPHTVTATDKSFDSGNLSPAQSFTFTFVKAGTYSYFCSYHSWMKGTVIVKAA